MWCGSKPLSYKKRWDNLAMVEVHCGECIVSDEANKVQPCCLILDSWPSSRSGILLLSLHLSSPLCPLWTVTGGLPGAALITVCLSFSISHPRIGESSLGLGWTGEALNGRAHGWRTIGSMWYSRRLGVRRRTLVCATCLTADTVMNQSALSLQLYLPNLAPHLYYACKMDVLVRS